MKKYRNPKHTYYVSLLNSQEWQGVYGLRARTLRKHPLCQICEKKGIVSSAVDVHHLQPVESVGGRYNEGETLPESVKAEMRRRCFDENNVIALCVPCHINIHKEMRSHYGQMRELPNIPHEEQKREPTALGSFCERMTGTAYREKPKPKKGIRRTPLGWMTREEFKERQQQNLDKWANKLKDGFTDTTGAASVDAHTED
jgi:5-methylcytosine-specific restriction endonuclease McrA